MDKPRLNRSDIKRLFLGIIGVGSILFGLIYIISACLLLFIFFKIGDSSSFLIALVGAILFIALGILLMVFGYPLFISATKGKPLDWDKIIKVSPWLIFAFILVYAVPHVADFWNQNIHVPGVGEYITKDNFTFELQSKEAVDQLGFYNCPETMSTGGWQFFILNYYLNNEGNTSLSISPSFIEDGNGVIYHAFYPDCIREDRDYDQKDTPAKGSKFGKLVYKIPANVVPAYLTLYIEGIYLKVRLN
jgi:hypothetical protein